MTNIDPHDSRKVSEEFDIAGALAREVVYMNDEWSEWGQESPEHRWARMRQWALENITGGL